MSAAAFRRIAFQSSKGTERDGVPRTAVDERLLARWRPLAEWLHAGEVSRAARDLLGGIEPEDPANGRELLALALLAVSVNRDWLREEFAMRSFLGLDDAPLGALVERQEYLTRETIGTAGPLRTLGALVAESLPSSARSQFRRSAEPAWEHPPGWRKDTAVIWLAAVRFGHLAQTIAGALALEQRLLFYRYLPANCANRLTTFLPNDIACVNEPWEAGTRRILSYCQRGSLVFELAVPPAGIVAVAHFDPTRANEEHPAKFAGESGHPVVTVYPPLAQFARQHYEGPRQLVQWRRVAPAEVRNH